MKNDILEALPFVKVYLRNLVIFSKDLASGVTDVNAGLNESQESRLLAT